MIKKVSFAISYIIMIISISACAGIDFSTWHFPYMMQVQQGNYISTDQLNQLKIGMSKDQVAYTLESKPISQFMFNQNLWQYIYQERSNNKLIKNYTITLHFDTSDLLSKIEQDGKVFAN